MLNESSWITEEMVKNWLLLYEGEYFTQKTGRTFTYKVKGDYVYPSRTNKITIPIKYFLEGYNRKPLNTVSELQ